VINLLRYRLFPPADAREAALVIQTEGLQQRAAKSGIIRVIAQVIQFFIAVGSGMILARLLRPEDFGIFAMVGSLTAFVGSFRDFGLPMATVHQKQVDHEQMNALFWLNLRLNIFLLLGMIAMGPVLAWFYGEPILVYVVAVCAVGVFLIDLSLQHESLLTRQMRFGAMAMIDLTSVIGGVLIAVALATMGAGVWALAAQFIAALAIKAVGAWLACEWRPTRTNTRQTNVRAFTRYGKDVMFFRIIAHIGRNLDRVVVGFFSGATALGLYQNAYKWSTLPVQQIYAPLLNVAVTTLSRLKDTPDEYRRTARGLMLPVFALSMPTLAFLAIESERVMLFLLGEQWLDAAPLFQLLCIAAIVGEMSMLTKWLYLSYGETRPQLRWSLFYTPVMVTAVFLGAQFGAYGVALGFTLGTVLLTPFSIGYCLRFVPMTWGDFIGVSWRPLLASAVATIGVAFFPATGSSLFLNLLSRAVPFFVVYVLCWLVLPGGIGTVRETAQLLRRSVKRTSS
jgi:PST family polysaccharide transporter